MGEGTVDSSLRHKRVEAGLTQEEIAQRAGVTRQTIIAIERGNYVPSVLLALRLARELGCRVEDLFDVKERG